jgi:hypothetical protein
MEQLLTPGVVRKFTKLAAETRSFKRAVIAFVEADVSTSAKTVERVVHDVGTELAHRRNAPKHQVPLANRPENVPALAVVECDGGRIRTREPGNGPGVTLNGKGWNERPFATFQCEKLCVFWQVREKILEFLSSQAENFADLTD